MTARRGGTAPGVAELAAASAAGPVRERAGLCGVEWNVLGQTYLPKQLAEASFSWHATMPPGTHLPPHVHPAQDKFLYVLEGRIDVAIDGRWDYATQLDLVPIRRGTAHAIHNKSRHICKALFWVAPAGELAALFQAIHELPRQTPETVAELAGRYGVEFRGPG